MKKSIRKTQGRYFYSGIVDIESLKIALEEMDLSKKERSHLLEIVESTIHHVVLDAVLSELSEKEKKFFLSHLIADEHDKSWKLLKKKSENIEEKIKKAAEDLKEQLHKDIKEVKEGK